MGALIFIAVSATFYAVLGSLAPNLDLSAAADRAAFQPFNPAPAGATPAEVAAQAQASIDAFHLASLINAGLLIVGAAVSYVGLRDVSSPGRTETAPTASAVA
jgi:hypothetical protein